MRYTLAPAFALAFIAGLVACGGGGGTQAVLPVNNPPSHSLSGAIVSMRIVIPTPPPASSQGRHGYYVSPGTQSIGVVVTNQGATPSAAQYTNVSSCPTPSGVTTCTVSVQALPGTDTFVVSAYTAPNGGGSVLSSGSINSTIVAGVANVTMPVTMGGVIASISISPGIVPLPLGQSTTLNVVAKDASGATIVGPFDNPISLSASNMALSKTSIAGSGDGAGIIAAWSYGFAGASSTSVSASADGVTGSVTIAPGTGIAFYQTGTNPATDNAGFKMIAGSDGNLYYTSLGPLTCPLNSVCTSGGGAVHQFNPATGKDTEVALAGEGVGLTFTSDGALWIGGGSKANDGNTYVYRMAPGAFSAAALTPIPVPTTSAAANINIREAAQDSGGNLWFVDAGGHRYFSIPVAGPYASTSFTFHTFPNGVSGTPRYRGAARTIHYLGGVLVTDDFINGSVDLIDPTTGGVTAQYVTNLQTSFGSNAIFDSSQPYDSASDGSQLYLGQIGNWNAALPVGDVEAFNPGTHAFTTVPIVAGPSSTQPILPAVSGTTLYVSDFGKGSLDVMNLSTGSARSIPLYPGTGQFSTLPNGLAVLSDQTAWFSCYGSNATFQPLCVGHTVYLSGWSVFPGSAVTIAGAGTQGAQLMGIMEAPSANSGPFTESSSNTSVCTIGNASDHNFMIVGQAGGACVVTVTDAHGVSQTVNVTVTTTSGTVQARPGRSNGGSI